MVEKSDEVGIVTAHSSGFIEPKQLQVALEELWREMLNPAAKNVGEATTLKQAAAKTLGITPSELIEIPAVPLQLSGGRSGAADVDWALVVHYVEHSIVLAALTDLAKDELKARLRKLWNEVLVPTIKRRLNETQAIGSESPPK